VVVGESGSWEEKERQGSVGVGKAGCEKMLEVNKAWSSAEQNRAHNP